MVWSYPWLPDIIAYLFPSKNIEGNITNTDLELVALVLHKSTLMAAFSTARISAPCSGLDKTPTVLWGTREASDINLVVTYLPHIRALH